MNFFYFKNYYDKLAKQLKKGDVFVELGSYKGESIKYLNSITKGVELYTIDKFIPEAEYLRGEEYFDCFLNNIKRTKIKYIKGDTVETAEEFRDNSIDAIFFDASHTAEGLEAEIKAWLPKLKEDAIVAGDDYGHFAFPGIQQVVGKYFDIELMDSDNKVHKIWIKK